MPCCLRLVARAVLAETTESLRISGPDGRVVHMPSINQPAGRSKATWHGMSDEDASSSVLPTELNTVDASGFIAVSKDKLTARYVGRGNHSQDIGAVRTDHPCPPRCLLYYFEVAIADSGTRGSISVGLADSSFQLNRQPGWETGSYAYHGYDGRRYADSEQGEQYGPRFGMGDVVGCGFLAERREIFFTKNGAHLGIAFSGIVTAPLYPTASLHSPGERLTFNLGAVPFEFDVQSLVASERQARYAQILASPSPPVDIDSLVRAFLLHYNYGETLTALGQPAPHLDAGDATNTADITDGGLPDLTTASAAALTLATKDSAVQMTVHGATPDPAAAASADATTRVGRTSPAAHEAAMRRTLQQRALLCARLRSGDVHGTIDQLESRFPGLLATQPKLHFRLRCQHFIELIRSGAAVQAVAYAQKELAVESSPAAELAEVFALIAYEKPSDVTGRPAALMGVAHLEGSVGALNAAILQEQGLPSTCAIERLLRQLLAVCNAGTAVALVTV